LFGNTDVMFHIRPTHPGMGVTECRSKEPSTFLRQSGFLTSSRSSGIAELSLRAFRQRPESADLVSQGNKASGLFEDPDPDRPAGGPGGDASAEGFGVSLVRCG
jgi:hypothetical protein